MVNLEWYRTFRAIVEKKTLTRAAEALYASQPGVSVHLNALEAYVGKKLFERTSRKMIPTEEGKQLYNFVVEALERLEQAEQHFKKSTKETVPSLHIGMCNETFQTILEPEVSKLRFNLVAKFGGHQDLIKDLNKGLLDLVITPKKNHANALAEYEAFSKERIVLVAGSKTPLNAVNKLLEQQDLKALSAHLKQQIWYSASNEMDHFRRFWYDNFKSRADFKPNYILPNIGSIIRCLEAENGFAIVPDFLVQKAIAKGSIHLVWQGIKESANTLYFATRSDLQYKEEVNTIKEVFKQKMQPH
ncbi:LysR family transcriptional regulator [Leeuwenhoekiella palythoae]|uniref:LysR family transcriptional regulator n=1 Tax=Leeuwenhoekiella palythoae TaxID=573501 RepID=UPI001CE1D4DF|nr:LysR family transcriptional regulator [Leeuwenhoekiella palythoae]UBZ09804.1 LysR family transcriptional regulator [Leeuwenhoekiella palythoae]|tara:strand:- start:2114 stop:3019 length:906 start_codon:yes stop_codon:yes gene_type:complete